MDDLDAQIMAMIEREIGAGVATNGVLNSGQFPHPLTVERLAEQMEAFKASMPRIPAYYRVSQRTYDSFKSLAIPATNEFYRSLASVHLVVDETVPDGEARPSGERIEFILHNPPIPERFPSYVETVEEIPIAEAKRRYPENFEKENDD